MNLEALILDIDFNAVGILDSFKSFIWTDRYASAGDFEIYTPASLETIELLQTERYLYCNGTEHVMIIEGFRTDSDADDGKYLIITGRSLESILDRRIIWKQTNIDGNLQNGVQKLLNENIISPEDGQRRISNFIFEESTDRRITKLKLTAQYTGDNLYEVICKICADNDIGFKITLNNSNQFVFKLYVGEDRTYLQDKNTYVVFSSDFDNILNSSYAESKKEYKNVTLIAGEGEGDERRTISIGISSGMNRRELFTDARDISSNDGDTKISDEDYCNQLRQRGRENLDDYKISKLFEGEMDTHNMFIFDKDFYLGDIVQIKNEFGVEKQARITEMIHSSSAKEVSDYPTFEIIGEDEEPPEIKVSNIKANTDTVYEQIGDSKIYKATTGIQIGTDITSSPIK